MRVSLIHLLTFTLILVNGTTTQHKRKEFGRSTAVESADDNRWYTLVSPDGDFTLDFPSIPNQIADAEAPGVGVLHYSLSKEATLFQLAVIDSGFSPSSREGNRLPVDFTRQMLEQARDEKWIVVRAKLIRPDLYEQERWSPTNDPSKKFNIISRHVMRNGKHYTLGCSSLATGERVDAKMCRRFFESFHLLKSPNFQ